MKTFEQFRQEISILELAIANGYRQIKSKGERSPVLYNAEFNDRIIVVNPRVPSNQGYWNPHDESDKGSLIGFVKRRLGGVFPQNTSKTQIANVNDILYNYLKIDPDIRNKNTWDSDYKKMTNIKRAAFSMEDHKVKKLADASFLLSRGISKEIIQAPLFVDRILNSNNKGFRNIAFPYYDAFSEKVVGLEIRNEDFKKAALGSDKSSGLWHSNIPEQTDRMIFFESAIDALSYYELKGQANDLYVSFGGRVTQNQIQTAMDLQKKSNPSTKFTFISATDNDKEGVIYDLSILINFINKEVFTQNLPSTKDFISLGFVNISSQLSLEKRDEQLQLFANRMVTRLAPYNDELNVVANGQGISEILKIELKNDRFTHQIEENKFVVGIPNNFFAIHYFNQQLAQTMDIKHQIQIEKAIFKDFNDDLRVLKYVNNQEKSLTKLDYNRFIELAKIPASREWMQSQYQKISTKTTGKQTTTKSPKRE
jgi:hypothetical protein